MVVSWFSVVYWLPCPAFSVTQYITPMGYLSGTTFCGGGVDQWIMHQIVLVSCSQNLRGFVRIDLPGICILIFVSHCWDLTVGVTVAELRSELWFRPPLQSVASSLQCSPADARKATQVVKLCLIACHPSWFVQLVELRWAPQWSNIKSL